MLTYPNLSEVRREKVALGCEVLLGVVLAGGQREAARTEVQHHIVHLLQVRPFVEIKDVPNTVDLRVMQVLRHTVAVLRRRGRRLAPKDLVERREFAPGLLQRSAVGRPRRKPGGARLPVERGVEGKEEVRWCVWPSSSLSSLPM